jgi:hypothetical protein
MNESMSEIINLEGYVKIYEGENVILFFFILTANWFLTVVVVLQ